MRDASLAVATDTLSLVALAAEILPAKALLQLLPLPDLTEMAVQPGKAVVGSLGVAGWSPNAMVAAEVVVGRAMRALLPPLLGRAQGNSGSMGVDHAATVLVPRLSSILLGEPRTRQLALHNTK